MTNESGVRTPSVKGSHPILKQTVQPGCDVRTSNMTGTKFKPKCVRSRCKDLQCCPGYYEPTSIKWKSTFEWHGCSNDEWMARRQTARNARTSNCTSHPDHPDVMMMNGRKRDDRDIGIWRKRREVHSAPVAMVSGKETK